MLKEFVRDPQRRRCLQGTPLAAALTLFAAELGERGHAASTIARYGQSAGHFVSWLRVRDTPLAAVDEPLMARFLDQHLFRCNCPLPGPRTQFTVRAALHHFLRILRNEGRVPAPVATVPPAIDGAVAAFDGYMRDTCGLAPATRLYRRRYAQEFLEATFGNDHVDAGRLQPTDIERFVTQRARTCSPGSAQVLASSLRSWLRFQQMRGAVDAGLAAAVPRIPRWRLASVPTGPVDADVRRLLGTFDRKTSTGQRDYAMARCLVDLGLRACEVARLRLEDVDWRRGAIRVSGSKTRRVDELPLPAPLGRAIASYLRYGRPPTQARALFVRHHVPIGAPIAPSVVRQALARAALAADLAERWRGPHSLRHSTATRLLRGGASLKEVADVLRHRCLDTTAIYAKVDLARLRQVPLPWPGRTP